MQLTSVQLKQLDDVVKQTRITRGKNSGKRKDTSVSIDHFDMRSFNKLIAQKLVAPSGGNYNSEWYATELGYQEWINNQH